MQGTGWANEAPNAQLSSVSTSAMTLGECSDSGAWVSFTHSLDAVKIENIQEGQGGEAFKCYSFSLLQVDISAGIR